MCVNESIIYRSRWRQKLQFCAARVALQGLTGIVICILVAGSAFGAGNSRQALVSSVLRVCADPSNLPYSNKAGEGLENRIVNLVADYLGVKVQYTWYPQSTGFVRNTLRLRECDLVSGITTTSEKVQNTNPYYHSVYVLLYRKDRNLDIKNLSDPKLRDMRIGVVAGTPPATLLAQLGLLDRIKSYHLIADTRHRKPAKNAILDVISGETDVALVWGPLAAWHALESEIPLELIPLLDENRFVQMNFRVSMAVRYNEVDWKRKINSVLETLKPEIDEILREYGVPLLNDRGELAYMDKRFSHASQ